MTIYTIIRGVDGATADVDTSEEVPSAAIFDLFNYDGNTIAWSDVASIEGAAEALVTGNLSLAEEHLADLDFKLERRGRRVLTVIENMRRITRYEVDETDLTLEMIGLLNEVGDSGGEVDDEYLVDSLTEAAGEGEVLGVDPADVPGFFVTDTTIEGS